VKITVVIGDELMAAAMASTGLTAKKAAIKEALWALVRLHGQEKVRSLRGKLRWGGDLGVLREGRFADVEC